MHHAIMHALCIMHHGLELPTSYSTESNYTEQFIVLTELSKSEALESKHTRQSILYLDREVVVPRHRQDSPRAVVEFQRCPSLRVVGEEPVRRLLPAIARPNVAGAATGRRVANDGVLLRLQHRAAHAARGVAAVLTGPFGSDVETVRCGRDVAARVQH